MMILSQPGNMARIYIHKMYHNYFIELSSVTKLSNVYLYSLSAGELVNMDVLFYIFLLKGLHLFVKKAEFSMKVLIHPS